MPSASHPSNHLSVDANRSRIPVASKLTKASHKRVPSGQLLPPGYPPPPPPNLELHGQPTVTSVSAAPATTELLPPHAPLNDTLASGPSTGSQPASRASTRPGTPVLDGLNERHSGLPAPSNNTKAKRRSWLLGGARSSDERVSESGHGDPLAWVIGHHGKVPYNLSLLIGGEKVPELWNENGDTFVYLFPRNSGRGPSFRIDSNIYAASPAMTRLAYGKIYSDSTVTSSNRRRQQQVESTRRQSSEVPTPPRSPDPSAPEGSSDGSKGSRTLSDITDDIPSEIHLYLPLSLTTERGTHSSNNPEPRSPPTDVEQLVTYRNLVAFLLGQSLVATEKHSSIFDIFMRISDILQHYDFSNVDGSTYGEVAAMSFDNYVDELHVADMRSSHEKTIEGIVLGERMRSVMLYTEAFVHGVGKYEDLTRLGSPKFEFISPLTRNRMERASMDLFLRLKSINTRLEDFDFPAVFSGLMNSKTADESKVVRFDAWKSGFMATRKHVVAYYKHKYGSWPPKASSKKNSLETSGLNRLVLIDLYHDVSHLYNLLVDRKSLTTRTVEGPSDDDGADDVDEMTTKALRRVLSEYDRSSPPVQPPVPFDIPIYPDLKTTRGGYGIGDAKKDAKTRRKKLKDDEIATLLKASYNPNSDISTPFLDTFRDLERKSAHGKNFDDLCDLRTGQWMFMYAVLQSLPMLVVDAPGVRWTEGVEYFLCEPPRSGVPWAREDTGIQRGWYSIAGSSGLVSLPSDVVEHGVEGIYRRSHCWQMAEIWAAHSDMLSAAVAETLGEPLPPPGLLQPPGTRSRSQSPSRRRESAMMLGLEALPLPAGVAPVSPALRPKSSNDPTKTFDAILQSTEVNAKGKKKK